MRLMSKARPSQKTRPTRHGFKKSPDTPSSGLVSRLDDEFLVTGGYVTSLRNIVPAPCRPIEAATGCIRQSYSKMTNPASFSAVWPLMTSLIVTDRT